MKTRRLFWATLLAGFAALCFWKKAPKPTQFCSTFTTGKMPEGKVIPILKYKATDGVRDLVVKRRDWCTTEMRLNPEWVKAGPEADIHFCWNAHAFKEFRKDK